VCGWVGFHYFLLTMIFWQPGNLNYHYKKKMDGDGWRRFMGCRFLVALFQLLLCFLDGQIMFSFSRCQKHCITTWPSQNLRIHTNSSMAFKSLGIGSMST
jgi:hypothetical protein